MNWLTTDPPKDSSFIADVWLPYAVIAAWNESEKKFCFSDFRIGLFECEWMDTYFENEYIDTIKAWMPLPEIKND
ncbi:MAG: hypothetical protein WC449_05810 [Candidatus Paceibacterota bacterium]